MKDGLHGIHGKTGSNPMENDGFAMEKNWDLRIGLNIHRQNWDVEGHMDSVRSAEEGKERNAKSLNSPISQRDSTKMMDISLKRVSSGAGILGMFFFVVKR